MAIKKVIVEPVAPAEPIEPVKKRKKPVYPKAKKAVKIVIKEKPSEKKVEVKKLEKAFQEPKKEKPESFVAFTVKLLAEKVYTDAVIRELLAERFPDRNLKGHVSFVRSGMNKHVIGKNLINSLGVKLPIVQIV